MHVQPGMQLMAQAMHRDMACGGNGGASRPPLQHTALISHFAARRLQHDDRAEPAALLWGHREAPDLLGQCSLQGGRRSLQGDRWYLQGFGRSLQGT